MPTVTELIRKHLEAQIRPAPRSTLNEDPSKGDRPSLEELRTSQWSPKFEQLMRNRLIVGAMRYETFFEKRRNNPYEILKSIKRRIQLYEETGNQEHLVDSANLLLIEFECPTHPDPHLVPIDDGEHVQRNN